MDSKGSVAEVVRLNCHNCRIGFQVCSFLICLKCRRQSCRGGGESHFCGLLLETVGDMERLGTRWPRQPSGLPPRPSGLPPRPPIIMAVGCGPALTLIGRFGAQCTACGVICGTALNAARHNCEPRCGQVAKPKCRAKAGGNLGRHHNDATRRSEEGLLAARDHIIIGQSGRVGNRAAPQAAPRSTCPIAVFYSVHFPNFFIPELRTAPKSGSQARRPCLPVISYL